MPRRIGAQEIERLARLSSLELGAGEIDKLAEELQKLVAYMQQLEEVQIPAADDEAGPEAVSTGLRPDLVRTPGGDEPLAATPRRVDGYVAVPRACGTSENGQNR